ncbi:MAG: SHOCT domain-containing protein [Humidesulfovibrio sp.]|nr:SHOCT domain-containing protein [Humidesulfovibrio sp.]
MLINALASLGFLCQSDGSGYGTGYGPYGGYHMMSPLGGGLFMMLLLVLVFVLFTRFANRSGGGQAESALEILKKRYARGEISKEDFERMKQDIKD